jgi:Carboxypeptidase regulatory-like domain
MKQTLQSVQRPLRSLSFLIVAIFLSLGAWAQTTYTIKGKITDNAGSAIPGVTVRLDGTNAGTTSSALGDYTLSTNAAAGSYKVLFFHQLASATQHKI